MIERDGFIDIFDKMGSDSFANACGPCIGMWDREGAEKKNEIHRSPSIVTFLSALMETKYNGFRRFARIGNRYMIAGDLGFNPLTDIINEDGEKMLGANRR
jgi:aconitate hydratase